MGSRNRRAGNDNASESREEKKKTIQGKLQQDTQETREEGLAITLGREIRSNGRRAAHFWRKGEEGNGRATPAGFSEPQGGARSSSSYLWKTEKGRLRGGVGLQGRGSLPFPEAGRAVAVKGRRWKKTCM